VNALKVIDGFISLLALQAVATLVVFLFGVWLLAAGSDEYGWSCVGSACFAYVTSWFWTLQVNRWVREACEW